jgi:hypothetical protein
MALAVGKTPTLGWRIICYGRLRNAIYKFNHAEMYMISHFVDEVHETTILPLHGSKMGHEQSRE